MTHLHRLQGIFLGLVCMSLYTMMKTTLGQFQLLPDYDYVVDTVSGPWTMPEARICSDSSPLMVLVMSAQSNFERRRAIRETWANGHSNVYFLIGQPCPYPPAQRLDEGGCTVDVNKTSLFSSNYTYASQLRMEHNRLLKEQDQHRDLLFSSAKESYRSLPSKLKRGYEFVAESCPRTVKWILKADDDFYVRIRSLSKFIEDSSASSLDPTVPTVMGKFVWWEDPVLREGKNAELEYQKGEYPKYATGSYGHVVSRPIAEFVAKNQDTLHDYQGEDTSLGIWLHEQKSLNEPIKWILAAQQGDITNLRLEQKLNETEGFSYPYERLKSRFDGVGDCMQQKFYVIGHDIEPNEMRRCYNKDDDVKRFRKIYNKTDVTVVVMSHRSNFDRRKAIRDTWAKGHSANVRFFVGQGCPIPRDQRLWLKCELLCSVKHARRWSVLKSLFPCQLQQNETHTKFMAREEKMLKEEQEEYNDIIFTPNYESYRGIVPKVKEAYNWAVKNTKSDWILKADDDMYVRVELLSRFLSRFSAEKPTVVGKINDMSGVWRDGKWAELDYKPDYYPKWAQGAAGHAVSRPVAEYISKNRETLHNYQGEDVSIGIWLDESPMKDNVDWQNSKLLQMENGCTDSIAVVIGHEMTPERQKECHAELKGADYIDFDAEEAKLNYDFGSSDNMDPNESEYSLDY
jgi:hypothetical protein